MNTIYFLLGLLYFSIGLISFGYCVGYKYQAQVKPSDLSIANKISAMIAIVVVYAVALILLWPLFIAVAWGIKSAQDASQAEAEECNEQHNPS